MLAITLNYIKKGEEAALNYNKLRYFYEASRTLNLTRAAQNLYISQPALSKHISDLENDFGTPLFVRTNRNLILTQAGEVLREECCRIFDREEELYRRVRAAAAQEGYDDTVARRGAGGVSLCPFRQRGIPFTLFPGKTRAGRGYRPGGVEPLCRLFC